MKVEVILAGILRFFRNFADIPGAGYSKAIILVGWSEDGQASETIAI